MQPQQTSYHKIGIRIKCPHLPQYWPAGNCIGLELLKELLSERLRCARLLDTNMCGAAGELNDGRVILEVSSLAPALPIIKATLRQALLNERQDCNIYYYDSAENIWRDANTGDCIPGMIDWLEETRRFGADYFEKKSSEFQKLPPP